MRSACRQTIRFTRGYCLPNDVVRIRILLNGLVFVAGPSASGGASAYEFGSEISYDVDTVTLTGSSRSSKEQGDWGVYTVCVNWIWDPSREYYYCSLYYVEYSFAAVIGEIYRKKQSDPINSAALWGYEKATTSYTIANPEGDDWTAQGQHYAGVHSYWATCFFNHCALIYAGTTLYELGETEAEEEVCGQAEWDKLMREYDDETYGVNLNPDCDDFADSGDSDEFTWSQLNGGFSTGNPHEPYGIVEQDLKDGLDYIATNYANFEGVNLTSGYRCPHGNAAVGGAKNSAHVHGRAGDLLRPGWTKAEFNDVKEVAKKAGAYKVSKYEDYSDHHLHVHF